MCDVKSTDGEEFPARMGSVLIAGFLTGLIAAIALLAQGGGFLAALGVYAGVGAVTTFGAATFIVVRCRFLEGREMIEARAAVAGG
jgi:hypothetical protein